MKAHAAAMKELHKKDADKFLKRTIVSRLHSARTHARKRMAVGGDSGEGQVLRARGRTPDPRR